MAGQASDLEVSKNIINVRRKHVFVDGIRKIGRPNFEPSLPLSVRFADELGSSEGAVDLGGPTREFLRLAVSGMFMSNGFGGPGNNKVIVLNQEGTVCCNLILILAVKFNIQYTYTVHLSVSLFSMFM